MAASIATDMVIDLIRQSTNALVERRPQYKGQLMGTIEHFLDCILCKKMTDGRNTRSWQSA